MKKKSIFILPNEILFQIFDWCRLPILLKLSRCHSFFLNLLSKDNNIAQECHLFEFSNMQDARQAICLFSLCIKRLDLTPSTTPSFTLHNGSLAPLFAKLINLESIVFRWGSDSIFHVFAHDLGLLGLNSFSSSLRKVDVTDFKNIFERQRHEQEHHVENANPLISFSSHRNPIFSILKKVHITDDFKYQD
jgi:hypothetical protein